MKTVKGARLYGILDLAYVREAEAVVKAQALLEGGVDLLQLRAKGVADDVIRQVGKDLIPLCKDAGIPFILNDDPGMAAELDADGVHIGQDDGSLEEARVVIGDGKLIGRSTHSLEQARAALAEGFDYIGFGPLFPTPTKLGRPGIGTADIEQMEREVGSKIPAFCIGGIKRNNLDAVIAAGARRVVIVSDLLSDGDTKRATIEVLGHFV